MKTTFTKYLNQVRVEKVCELMIKNIDELHVRSIAYEVGYGDISHFYRVFRSIKNMTPLEYVALVKSSKAKEEDSSSSREKTFCNKENCVCYAMSLKILSTCGNAVPIRPCGHRG